MIKSRPRIEANTPLPALEGQQLLSEIADLRTAPVSLSRKVGYTLLNRHRLGQAPAIVAPGGFMSDLTAAGRVYEGISLAGLGRPVMMVDLPGHGLSSPHSFRQTRGLCFERRVERQAAPLVDSVLAVLPPDDPIDYFGLSYGGLLAIEMARADPGDRVGKVFGLDLPAVKKRWSLGLQLGYLLVDGRIGCRQYRQYLADEPLFEHFDNFLADFERLGIEPAAKFPRNDPVLAGLNLFMSVGARPAALDAWSEVMEQKSAKVDVVTAEFSRVSDHEAIETFINSMKLAHQRRSRQTVLEGEDHNAGMAPLIPRAVTWAARAYEA